MEMVEFDKSQSIDDEPTFVWWVLYSWWWWCMVGGVSTLGIGLYTAVVLCCGWDVVGDVCGGWYVAWWVVCVAGGV